MNFLQRTNDQLKSDLHFATKIARNFAVHGNIDYEGCAADAVLTAISKPTPEGCPYHNFLAGIVKNKVRQEISKLRRRPILVVYVSREELDSLPSRPTVCKYLLESLTPVQKLVAHEVLLNGCSEREVARDNGLSRRQVSENLDRAKQILKRQLGA